MAQTACMDACKHIADNMLQLLKNDEVVVFTIFVYLFLFIFTIIVISVVLISSGSKQCHLHSCWGSSDSSCMISCIIIVFIIVGQVKYISEVALHQINLDLQQCQGSFSLFLFISYFFKNFVRFIFRNFENFIFKSFHFAHSLFLFLYNPTFPLYSCPREINKVFIILIHLAFRKKIFPSDHLRT